MGVGDEEPQAGNQGATLFDSSTGESAKVSSLASQAGKSGRHAASKYRLRRGQAVDRYVILYELGTGGMGVVYAAYDPELDRKVALKLLHADRSGSRGRARLMREAKAIAKLTHNNVVTVHDVGTFEKRVFLAMEFLDGSTFRRWSREKKRPWREVVRVLREAGAGLLAAHDADLVHRDFKPDNIVVEHGGRVVVLDFGLARRAGTGDDSDASDPGSSGERSPDSLDEPPTGVSGPDELALDLTRTGARLGTPAYMAPEQHLGASTDARTDQFAFCVVLWEALYGARPFRAESQIATAVQVVKGDIAEPPKGADVPAWIRKVMQRGMSSDSEGRYPSMRELLDDLARDPSRRQRTRLAIAGGIVLAVGAGIGGYQLWSSEAALCDGGSEHWNEAWDGARQEQVRTALLDTGTPYAKTAWVGVQATMDGYVQRWVDGYQDACTATHERREQSEEMLDLRMACLRARRVEAGALLDELAAADVSVVQNAVEAAKGLPRIEICADTERLSARVRPPEDDRTRRRVDALRARLSDARAKQLAGRYEDALGVATEVAEEAAEIDYAPLAAEASLRLGGILERRGEFERSERKLLEAIWAAEASHHEEVAAEAWVRLVWVAGVERSDVKSGHQWAEFADAALRRLGRSEWLEATLTHNVGGVLYRERRLEDALDHYRRALREQQRLLGADDPAVGMTLNHIGNTLIELGNYAAAQEYCQRSLKLRRKVLGDRHPKVAASLNNLGELYRKRKDPQRSLHFAERSLEITGGTGGPEEIVALVLAGGATMKLERPDDAAAYFERLLSARRSLGPANSPAIVATMRSLAKARRAQNRADDAVALLREITEIEADRRPAEAATAYRDLADIERARNNVEAAEAATARATELDSALEAEDED